LLRVAYCWWRCWLASSSMLRAWSGSKKRRNCLNLGLSGPRQDIAHSIYLPICASGDLGQRFECRSRAPECSERVAQVVLRPSPVERHALAGSFPERSAIGGDGVVEPAVPLHAPAVSSMDMMGHPGDGPAPSITEPEETAVGCRKLAAKSRSGALRGDIPRE
jgi:hypothetical protein